MMCEPKLVIKGDPVVKSWDWFNATDPSVVKRSRWNMYFTAMNKAGELHILEAYKNFFGSWTINGPVVSPVAPFISVETPSYVKGMVNGKLVERIYFTGWLDKTNYRIGFAEFDGKKWVINPTVIEPDLSEISSYGAILGDQSVIYINKWFIFYQVGLNDRVVTMTAESDDGITWTNKHEVKLPVPNPTAKHPGGPYHIDVQKFGETWYFTGWCPHEDLTKQGIYTIKVSPTETKCIPLLMEGDGPKWFKPNPELQKDHINGLFGSCLVKDGAKFYIYFHTVTRPSTDVGNIGCVEIKL